MNNFTPYIVFTCVLKLDPRLKAPDQIMPDIGSEGTIILDNISYIQSGILIDFNHRCGLLHMLLKRNLNQGAAQYMKKKITKNMSFSQYKDSIINI